MSEFHFLRPLYFFLFIPLVIALVALWRKKRSQGGWGKVCDKRLLPYILKGEVKNHFPLFCLAVTGSLAITALAGPAWEQVLVPLVEEQSGLVIALDLSPAMNSEDLKPSRLQRALYKVDDILKRRREGHTALLVYTDEAFVVTPLTDDTRTISAMLSSLDTSIMPTQGSLNHDKAIAKAAELLKQGGLNHGAILLVTTGSAAAFADQGIPVSILGAGTEQGAPVPKGNGGFMLDDKGGVIISKIDKIKLKRQTEATGGRFALISPDDSDIRYLLQPAGGDYGAKDAQGHWQWLDGGYWLVLFSLPFAALLLRRGYLALTLILFSFELQAGLWRTNDQKGQDLYGKELYAEAAAEFQDPSWRAAAYYKAKDYAAAAELYKMDRSADGFYNLGNSLAMQGSLEEAIAAYEKALEIEPGHEDAAHNKKLLEEKKQQSEQNQNNDQQDNNDQQEGKNEQNQQGDQKNDKQEQGEPKQEQQEKEQSSQEPKKEEKEEYAKQMDKEIESQPKEEQRQEVAESDPQKEIDDRWLNRIPDDPGGLLRRKFLYQYNKGRS